MFAKKAKQKHFVDKCFHSITSEIRSLEAQICESGLGMNNDIKLFPVLVEK